MRRDPGRLEHFTREPWFEGCLRLCELYRTGGESQRTWIRSAVDRGIAGRIRLFGLRAAILGAREGSVDLSRAGLIAFAIADLSATDIRDVLIGFTLVVHCARLAGTDVPALLREVAAMAGVALGTLFREWAGRYPDVSRIGAMGWREVQTENGVGFRI